MSEQLNKKTVGLEELERFGESLNNLRGSDCKFELKDADNRFQECSLDDVIQEFQLFYSGQGEIFCVRINYPDQHVDIAGYTLREFRRVK